MPKLAKRREESRKDENVHKWRLLALNPWARYVMLANITADLLSCGSTRAAPTGRKNGHERLNQSAIDDRNPRDVSFFDRNTASRLNASAAPLRIWTGRTVPACASALPCITNYSCSICTGSNGVPATLVCPIQMTTISVLNTAASSCRAGTQRNRWVIANSTPMAYIII